MRAETEDNYSRYCALCGRPVFGKNRYCERCLKELESRKEDRVETAPARKAGLRGRWSAAAWFMCGLLLLSSAGIIAYSVQRSGKIGDESSVNIEISPEPTPDDLDSESSDSSTESEAKQESDNEERLFYGENSPLSKPGFISFANSGLKDHVMSWNDEGLEEAMERATGIPGDQIMLSDVFDKTEFDLMKQPEHKPITDITALRELRNIEVLNINFNDVMDLTELRNMPDLRKLFIRGNQVEDLSPLFGMTKLQSVDLSRNPFRDIMQIPKIRSLRRITICQLGLTDENFPAFMEALAENGGMQKIDISRNEITDYSPLKKLPYLTELYIEYVKMDDERFSSLCSLIGGELKTERLTVQGNRISNLEPVRKVTELEYLNIANNRVTDVSPLIGMKKLKSVALTGNEGVNSELLTANDIELSPNVSYQDAG